MPLEGADAKQHARLHEGVRDHAVDQARQHRAPFWRCRARDIADPACHRASAAAVASRVPQGALPALHFQRARPVGLCKTGTYINMF